MCVVICVCMCVVSCVCMCVVICVCMCVVICVCMCVVICLCCSFAFYFLKCISYLDHDCPPPGSLSGRQ